ncbi:hypothetical protein [Pannonibacter phragmitetus]|uniref:hypothetical protein n=1 Tax=Pannonibacter phragmitetus TaxID=121719 RepID=UPI003D2EFAF8
MRGISFWFFISAMFYGVGSLIFGIQMSAGQGAGFATANVQLTLLGFLTMTLFGLYYNAVPQAAHSRLARLHFVAATIGMWLMIPGVAIAIEDGNLLLALTGSAVMAVSMVPFVMILRRLRRIAAHAAG